MLGSSFRYDVRRFPAFLSGPAPPSKFFKIIFRHSNAYFYIAHHRPVGKLLLHACAEMIRHELPQSSNMLDEITQSWRRWIIIIMYGRAKVVVFVWMTLTFHEL